MWNLFRKASPWNATASPPKLIINDESIVFILIEAFAMLMVLHPLVISKMPLITPVERFLSTPTFSKIEINGVKIWRDVKTSVITKKTATYPPIRSTESIEFSI